MKKREAEAEIRERFREFAIATDHPKGVTDWPSVSAFTAWLEATGCGHLLNFRTSTSRHGDIDRWITDEFKRYRNS